MSEKILEILNITKVYRSKKNETQALKGVTLDIQKGEIISLLGVNGAGKTTLSSILGTLQPPTSGDVLFKGQSIYKDLVRYRMALGFCAQRSNLDMHFNVRDNLVFTGRYYLMPEDEVQKRADELLREFNLMKYATFEVNALSGGYRQRLMIARSLMHKPELLILDEPTVALDPGIRRALWESIRGLKKMGVTVILTTHYLEEAEVLSDRVCILHEGKILLIDEPHNLKKQFEKANLEEVFLHLTKEDVEEVPVVDSAH